MALHSCVRLHFVIREDCIVDLIFQTNWKYYLVNRVNLQQILCLTSIPSTFFHLTYDKATILEVSTKAFQFVCIESALIFPSLFIDKHSISMSFVPLIYISTVRPWVALHFYDFANAYRIIDVYMMNAYQGAFSLLLDPYIVF